MKKWLFGGCGLLALLGAVLLVFGLFLMSTYNRMVTLDQRVQESWSQVENTLQRRADLVPNLVETVKGYAAHEREVFEEVARARGRLAGAATPQEASAANAGLTSALGRLLAIAEAYPQLRASENFTRLQDELAGTENRIAVARRDYNGQVREFNTLIARFPANVAARMLGFAPRDFFEADEGSREVPKVDFGSPSGA
ncbi:MAG TPA: LemA family protein [Candidatus Polarisedimenticolia bacterium]|nr:LemA family protein [Candidatus Polarisedimenticolia bacterium]